MAVLTHDDAWTEAITLGDALLRTAAERPDHSAIAMPDGSWSYGELADRAKRIARNLIGLGVAPGEHVGVLMPNSFDILATCFGVSLAGASIVPINARFRTREMGYIVDNADLACVVTSDANDAYVDYLDLLIGDPWRLLVDAGGGSTPGKAPTWNCAPNHGVGFPSGMEGTDLGIGDVAWRSAKRLVEF